LKIGKIIFNDLVKTFWPFRCGKNDWTREEKPVGQAKVTLEEFIAFYKGL
jgi:hypothetical protein